MRDWTVKRIKRSSKRRWKITILLLVAILIMFAVGPFAFRMERLKQAKSDYNIRNVQDELQWLDKYGGPLNKLALIIDTKLWLELNLGIKDVEQRLAAYQDEKHQLWLVMFNLHAENLTKAQNLLETMSSSPRKQLGKGVLAFAKGDAKQIRVVLAKSEADWQSMTRQEQCLRHLTLAQAAMLLEDNLSAKVELEVAQQLEPSNPANLSVAFDLAIAQGQRAKARELSQLIDTQTWRPQNSLYLTKRAVLAIHENDTLGLANSLALLKELPQGDASINYLNGINALKKGQLQEGKILLELALKSGLEGQVQVDAQKALEQVSERQNADRVLRSL